MCYYSGTPTAVVTLLSAGTELLQHPGNDITLQCEFRMDRFHPFANPLVWRKSQLLNGAAVEWSTVNVMGVLQEDDERSVVTPWSAAAAAAHSSVSGCKSSRSPAGALLVDWTFRHQLQPATAQLQPRTENHK